MKDWHLPHSPSIRGTNSIRTLLTRSRRSNPNLSSTALHLLSSTQTSDRLHPSFPRSRSTRHNRSTRSLPIPTLRLKKWNNTKFRRRILACALAATRRTVFPNTRTQSSSTIKEPSLHTPSREATCSTTASSDSLSPLTPTTPPETKHHTMVLLVLQPCTKIFELLPLHHTSSTIPINTIQTHITHSCTDTRLTHQSHIGIVRVGQMTHIGNSTTLSSLEDEQLTMQAVEVHNGDLLVAIPEGYSRSECLYWAWHILKNPKILKLCQRIQRQTHVLKGWEMVREKPVEVRDIAVEAANEVAKRVYAETMEKMSLRCKHTAMSPFHTLYNIVIRAWKYVKHIYRKRYNHRKTTCLKILGLASGMMGCLWCLLSLDFHRWIKALHPISYSSPNNPLGLAGLFQSGYFLMLLMVLQASIRRWKKRVTS